MRIDDLARFPEGHPPSPYPFPMPLQREGIWGTAHLPQGLSLYAVGWLGDSVPTVGDSPGEVLDRLGRAYDQREVLSDGTAGWHDCEVCTSKEDRYPNGEVGPVVIWRDRARRLFGHGHHLVQDGTRIYICPVLILHYILDHRYRPPDEFLEAVRRGTFLAPSDLAWKGEAAN